jgi:hypothetical protein
VRRIVFDREHAGLSFHRSHADLAPKAIPAQTNSQKAETACEKSPSRLYFAPYGRIACPRARSGARDPAHPT